MVWALQQVRAAGAPVGDLPAPKPMSLCLSVSLFCWFASISPMSPRVASNMYQLTVRLHRAAGCTRGSLLRIEIVRTPYIDCDSRRSWSLLAIGGVKYIMDVLQPDASTVRY